MKLRNRRRKKNYNLRDKIQKYRKLLKSLKHSNNIKEIIIIFFLHHNQKVCQRVWLMNKNNISIIICKLKVRLMKKTKRVKEVRKLWKNPKHQFQTKLLEKIKKYLNLTKEFEFYLIKINIFKIIHLFYEYI